MIFRTQLAVGAILFAQCITLGSNVVGANDDAENLRRRTSEQHDIPESGDRELAPLQPPRFGQGNGYLSNSNNRFSSPRIRGQGPGSQLLRPYAPTRNVPFAPNRIDTLPQKATKATKGGKAEKADKAGSVKIGKNLKSAKSNSLPQRSSSYLNSMNWQRVPGQPIFVSQTDIPILILDEQPILVLDEYGNFILVDENGNEIVITIGADGNPIAETIGGNRLPPRLDLDDGGNFTLP
jgi:hypothetical protein